MRLKGRPTFAAVATVLFLVAVAAIIGAFAGRGGGAERGSRVRSAVGSLPPEQKMMIVLRYTQGLTYEQIAGILGCSTGTIASRLNRVHKVLERRLSRLAGATGGNRV